MLHILPCWTRRSQELGEHGRKRGRLDGISAKQKLLLLGSRGGSFRSPLPDLAELHLELQLALADFPLAPLYILDVFTCVFCAQVAALTRRKAVRFLTGKGETVVLQSSRLRAAFQALQEETRVRPDRSPEPRPTWLAGAMFLTLHGPSASETTQLQKGTWPAENLTASLLRAASFKSNSCPM